MFTKKEMLRLLLSILLLGLVFGFDDGRKEFTAILWLTNLLKIITLVAIAVLLRETTIKIYTRTHEIESEYKFWFIKRFGFKDNQKLKKGIPFGILLSLFGSFISSGKFFFTAIGMHELKENNVHRTGRNYIFIKYYEESLAVLSGIFANLFLIYLSFFISKYSNFDLSNFMKINFFLIVFNLLPFSSLDGAKIFFGSRFIWIFICLFVFFSFIFLKLGIIFSIIGAILLAFIILVVYYYKYEYV